jgi:ADP-heptose:LPS heptosyltransferase
MKILVIRFSAIGDIVLASPVLRCLKKQLPNCALHFLTKQSFKAVTEANPYVNTFFYFNGNNLNQLITQFKTENYDYVIDLQNNSKSLKIKWALSKPFYAIDKLNVEKFILTNLKINVMPNRHITQRSLDTVAALGVIDDGEGLDYFILEGQHTQPHDLPKAHSFGFVAIVIGASYATKQVPINVMQQFCSQLNYPIILVGGPEDAATGAAIASVDTIKIYNSCGKFNLHESADIVRQAKLVISNDTGMQYIACAFNKKIIALWGSTTPKLQVQPYYGTNHAPKHVNVIQNLWCQPCTKFGKKKCPLGHYNCMAQINVNHLLNLTQNMLAQ